MLSDDAMPGGELGIMEFCGTAAPMLKYLAVFDKWPLSRSCRASFELHQVTTKIKGYHTQRNCDPP